jgi:predicted ester cyclase
MSAQENTALVRREFDLLNAHQTDAEWLDKIVAPLADDFVLVDVPTHATTYGRDALRNFCLFFIDGFPGSSTEITNMVATEDQVVVEFIGRGVNTGPLHLPTGDVSPTGRSVEIYFCEVRRIVDGKIMSLHSYYDALGFMQQLGFIPSQE